MTRVYLYQKKDEEQPDHAWQHEMGLRLLSWAAKQEENRKLHRHNVSHSGRWVAVALSDAPVGVDVEVPRCVRKQLGEKIFTEQERAYLEKNHDDAMFFLQLWTLKESYGKAKRVGIAYPMKQVELLPGTAPAAGAWQEVSCSEADISSFSKVTENYALSVCILKKDEGAPEVYELKNLPA